MSKKFFRLSQAALLFISLLMLFTSFYLEFGLGLQPCPLCLMQRFCIFILTMLFLSGVCINTIKRSLLITSIQIFIAFAGIFFALRQVWLQSVTTHSHKACLPDFGMMLQYFPLKDIFKALFWGAADCAEIQWRYFGLTIPMWAALYFLMVAITVFVMHLGLKKRAH